MNSNKFKHITTGNETTATGERYTAAGERERITAIS